jgi:signal transduction histidine kinase
VSLRVRLIGAFAIVLAALAGLGAWSAWRQWEMGAVSNRIIADNYDSVVAAQEMKESLERQDSAILFLLVGERVRAERQLAEHRGRFAAALDRAAHNITEQGEREVVEAIMRNFADYSRGVDTLVSGSALAGGLPSRTYFVDAEPRFNRLRAECDQLLTLNQQAMRRKAAEAAAISRGNVVTAVTLALVLTVTGIVIAVLIVGSLLRPIGRLTAATAAVAAGDLDVTVPATGGREIAGLAAAFNDMAGKLRDVRDSNLGELMRARQVLLENVNQLKEIDRLKSAFVAAASHELRTPLMSFQMGVHLLLEDAGNLTARQLELLHLCRDESARLVRLSSELLDLSKIESGEAAPRLARIPVDKLLHGAIEPIRLQVEAHDISLVVEAPAGLPDVMADRTQIERVIANLLTNAVRATPAGGRIVLSAAVAGSRVAMAVADNGYGIPAEYLNRIFVPFIQVPGPPAGGAGLGLAISRRIVESHGGQMIVQSEPGRGATFTFTLPMAPAAREEGS